MARLPSITSKDQVAAKDRETWDSIVASRGAKGAAHATFEALCRGGVRRAPDDVRRQLSAASTSATATSSLDRVL